MEVDDPAGRLQEPRRTCPSRSHRATPLDHAGSAGAAGALLHATVNTPSQIALVIPRHHTRTASRRRCDQTHRRAPDRPSHPNAVLQTAPMSTRLERTYRFEAAHFLPKVPPGHKCARMHGHSYRIEVTIEGELDPDRGWVIGLSPRSTTTRCALVRLLDHQILNEVDGLANPTSELLAAWWWQHRLAPTLPQLVEVVVAETRGPVALHYREVRDLISWLAPWEPAASSRSTSWGTRGAPFDRARRARGSPAARARSRRRVPAGGEAVRRRDDGTHARHAAGDARALRKSGGLGGGRAWQGRARRRGGPRDPHARAARRHPRPAVARSSPGRRADLALGARSRPAPGRSGSTPRTSTIGSTTASRANTRSMRSTPRSATSAAPTTVRRRSCAATSTRPRTPTRSASCAASPRWPGAARTFKTRGCACVASPIPGEGPTEGITWSSENRLTRVRCARSRSRSTHRLHLRHHAQEGRPWHGPRLSRRPHRARRRRRARDRGERSLRRVRRHPDRTRLTEAR